MSNRDDKLGPQLIRDIFGDDLQGLWWLDQDDGATVVRDLSGNGHDAVPSNVEFEQRPLSKQLVSHSARFDGSSTKIEMPTIDGPVAGDLYRITMAFQADAVEPLGGPHCLISNRPTGGRPAYIVMLADTGHLQIRFMHTSGDNGPDFSGVPMDEPCVLDMLFDMSAGEVVVSINDDDPVTKAFTPHDGNYNLYDTVIGQGSYAGGKYFQGQMQWVAISEGKALGDEVSFLYERSGFDNLDAYHNPYYVSEYPDSPRRYFPEYVNDYLEARYKPAVEVWPKRRYGQATGRGVKGAHDGELVGGMTGDGKPVGDDQGQSLDCGIGQILEVTDDDFQFGTDSFTALTFFNDSTGSSRSVFGRGSPGSSDSRNKGWQILEYAFQIGSASDGTKVNASLDTANSVPVVQVGVRDVANNKLLAYTDGVLADTTVDANVALDITSTDSTGVGIGGGYNFAGSFQEIEGVLDCAAVTKHILTEPEIKHLSEAAFDRSKRYGSDFRFYDDVKATDPAGFIQFRYPTYAGEQVLFQDAACTTPVTTIGDIIRGVKDPLTGQIFATTSSTNNITWGGPDKGAVVPGGKIEMNVGEVETQGVWEVYAKMTPATVNSQPAHYFLTPEGDSNGLTIGGSSSVHPEKLTWYNGTTAQTLNYMTSVAGTEYRVRVAHDNGTFKMKVNDLAEQVETGWVSRSLSNVMLFTYKSGTNYAFDGTTPGIIFYDRVLTASEKVAANDALENL